MPDGKPRTDEERKEKHKEAYGDDDIPAERGGRAAKALGQNDRLYSFVKLALVLAILYFAAMILRRGGLL